MTAGRNTDSHTGMESPRRGTYMGKYAGFFPYCLHLFKDNF